MPMRPPPPRLTLRRPCHPGHPFRIRRAHRRNKSRVTDHDLLAGALHYPTNGAPETPSNSFLIDPGYIKRYRDPSRHDSYVIPDHHHPYEFRTRPNATQALPKSSSLSDARRARLSMEQSWLPSPSISPSSSGTLVHRHRVSLQPKTIPLSYQTRLGVCFPGSSSQYIGMGSFLEPSSKEFQRTWEEAQCGLNEFEAWFKGLNLVECFLEMGYNLNDSKLLGGPIRLSDLVFTDAAFGSAAHHLNRSLKDIVFHGPQNLLSHSVNAQPAILITSVAYLRSLEVEAKIPVRSITEVYAGHSSGEYTACVASDSIDFLSGIKLTRLYGLLSARSLELNRLQPSTFSGYKKSEDEAEGGGGEEGINHSKTNASKAQMSALLINEAYYHQSEPTKAMFNIKNSSQKLVNMMEFIRNFNLTNPKYPVEIASFNSSNQIVLSGTRAGVLAACGRLQELEIANRAADLPCSSPFHSSFMKPASDGMKIGIESIKFKPPRKPILIAKHVLPGGHEDEAGTREPRAQPKSCLKDMIEVKYIQSEEDLEQLKIHLHQSIDKPVWWSETVHELLNPGHRHHQQLLDHLLFVGPGKALKNLCNKQIGFDRRFGLHPSSPLNHLKARDHQLTLSLATMEDFDQFFFLSG